MNNEPKLWDKRIEFIAGLLLIAAHENEDKITISTSAIADLIHDRALYKQQAEEKEILLQHASRIIDSGMGAGILRYDPVQWFINYHKHKEGATK